MLSRRVFFAALLAVAFAAVCVAAARDVAEEDSELLAAARDLLQAVS